MESETEKNFIVPQSVKRLVRKNFLLNGMIGLKVKYIREKEVSIPDSYKLFFDVIPNKIYDVLSIEKGWYRIVDESEEDYLYPPEKFEVVEV